MSMIKTFNSTVSRAINKNDETYEAVFGKEDFVPEATIEESSDFNSGALTNELEFLRKVSDYYVQSFDLDIAEGDNLDTLIQGFIDLPRRSRGEADEVYRGRFRSIAVQGAYPRRTNKWAILQAIGHFIDDISTVQVIENFDNNNLYFEVRVEGGVDLESALFLDNDEQGFISQNFIGGDGIGAIITYLGTIIERIKAAGVNFDVLFVIQDRFTKTVDAVIAGTRKSITVDATVYVASAGSTYWADGYWATGYWSPSYWSI